VPDGYLYGLVKIKRQIDTLSPYRSRYLLTCWMVGRSVDRVLSGVMLAGCFRCRWGMCSA
jgi:hypothetical protein